jgi:AcrR family transcriptional regulator
MNDRTKRQTTVRKPRRRERINSTRVLERRGQTWEKLLATAGRLMAEAGPARVSVQQILLDTGISRGSFYGYCASKTDLLVAIIEPVFTEGGAALATLLNEPPKAVIPGIVTMYIDLWARHRHALMLIPGVDAATFSRMRNAHQAYTTAMKQALDHAAKDAQLRNDSAVYTFRILTRTAVPLLRVYQDHPDGKRLYRESMLALLLN